MTEEQLSWKFEDVEKSEESSNKEVTIALEVAVEEMLKDCTVLPEPNLHQCTHKVIFRACKKGYATYCNKCGKILSVRNRK